MQDLLAYPAENDYEFEEVDRCFCDNCEMVREIHNLRSSLIWILAQNPRGEAYHSYSHTNCPICGNNRRFMDRTTELYCSACEI